MIYMLTLVITRRVGTIKVSNGQSTEVQYPVLKLVDFVTTSPSLPYVWSTLFYGAETWAITKSVLSRLDTSKSKDVDRSHRMGIFKIFWTNNITNDEILRRMGIGGDLRRGRCNI